MASGKRIWKVKRRFSYDHISKSRFVLTDIGLLLSSGEGGADLDLIDPAIGEIKWRQQVSGLVRSIVDDGDLVLIVSGYGGGPYILNAYEKAR